MEPNTQASSLKIHARSSFQTNLDRLNKFKIEYFIDILDYLLSKCTSNQRIQFSMYEIDDKCFFGFLYGELFPSPPLPLIIVSRIGIQLITSWIPTYLLQAFVEEIVLIG